MHDSDLSGNADHNIVNALSHIICVQKDSLPQIPRKKAERISKAIHPEKVKSFSKFLKNLNAGQHTQDVALNSRIKVPTEESKPAPLSVKKDLKKGITRST